MPTSLPGWRIPGAIQAPWIDTRNYTSIDAAVAAATSAGTGLVISNSVTLDGSKTFSIPITIPYGGVIVKASTYTVTFNSVLEAGPYQIFSGFSAADISISEGSVKEVVPQWWGAVADGATNDTTAIQSAINCAAHGVGRVYFPGGVYNFTKLYIHYDASLNPGFPSGVNEKGYLQIYGNGMSSQTQSIAGTFTTGRTVLNSTDTTGPAILSDGGTIGTINGNQSIQIKDLNIIAENTTQVVKVIGFTTFSLVKDVLILQNGTGDGFYTEETWGSGFENLKLKKDNANTNTGVGVTVKNVSGGPGGGSIHNIFNCSVDGFLVGWKLSTDASEYDFSGRFTLIGNEARGTGTGFLIGGRYGDTTMIGCHVEDSSVNDVITGIKVTGGQILNVSISNCNITANTGIKVGGDVSNDNITGINIRNNFIVVNADNGNGIYLDRYNALTLQNAVLQDNYIYIATGFTGTTGIKITANTGKSLPRSIVKGNNISLNFETLISGTEYVSYYDDATSRTINQATTHNTDLFAQNIALAVQKLNFATSITPDISQGSIISIGALTDNIVIDTPINAAGGMRVTYQLLQDGTGGRTVGWVSSTANLLSEGFEGAGYEDTWAETIDSGCTLDEDSAIPGTAPIGTGSQCLKAVVTDATNKSAYAVFTGSSQNVNYVSAYVYLDSDTLSDGNYFYPVMLTENILSSVVAAPFFLQSSGNLRIGFKYFSDGLVNNAATATLVPARWYFIQFKYDLTSGTWEWRLDGNVMDSGILEGTTRTPIKLVTGIYGTGNAPATGATVYIDNVGWSNVAWVSSGGYLHSWSDTGNTANKRSSISFISDGNAWVQDGVQVGWY